MTTSVLLSTTIILFCLLFPHIIADNEIDSKISNGSINEENGHFAALKIDSEKVDLKKGNDDRQLGGTRPRFVSVILGSLTVLTATLTLYRFIESRGARERQVYFNSLIEDLAEMQEALSSRVSAHERNLKEMQCRYDVEVRGVKEVSPDECKEFLENTTSFDFAAQEQESSQNLPISIDSPEAQMWFKNFENSNNISAQRRMLENSKFKF